MKKLFLLTSIAISCVITNVSAQEGRGFDPAKMKENQKNKLKEDLKLTDAQADSVATIQIEYMPKLRGLRGVQGEERMAKMKEINDAYKTRLNAALGDASITEKVLAYQEEQRKQRMERMRSGE